MRTSPPNPSLIVEPAKPTEMICISSKGICEEDGHVPAIEGTQNICLERKGFCRLKRKDMLWIGEVFGPVISYGS
jgi:hypothetical protein